MFVSTIYTIVFSLWYGETNGRKQRVKTTSVTLQVIEMVTDVPISLVPLVVICILE